MTYPYIGENKHGQKGLIYGNGKGVYADGSNPPAIVGQKIEPNFAKPSRYKNITAEYLANTCGEVKNKEHAEFIVKLAEVNGIDFDGEIGINSNYFCFFPSNSKQLTFWRKEKDASKHGSRKKITIPLPPECEGVDEWPVVGSSVEWGHTGKGEVKSLSDGFAWVKLDNKDYTTVYVSSLRKPKTPEQELRDEVISYFRKIGQNGIVLIGRYDEVADDFLSKYNITKKGEGGE